MVWENACAKHDEASAHRIKNLLMEIYEQCCGESPLDRERVDQFQKEILAIVKGYTAVELGVRKGEERIKANINNLANHFGLPFECEKKDKKWIVSRI